MTGPWSVDVPMVMTDKRGRPVPWVLNDRVHWSKRRMNAAKIRSDVTWLIRQAKIPRLDHVTVQLHYAPGDNRRRDADNLVATAKPAVDALVTAGVVSDDAPEFVTHLMPAIHKGPGRPRRLWLTIEVSPAPTLGLVLAVQSPRGAPDGPTGADRDLRAADGHSGSLS